MTVPPANTTSDVPGSSVPPLYVQVFVVRIVPASVSVPDGLLIVTQGEDPGGRRRRAGQRLSARRRR